MTVKLHGGALSRTTLTGLILALVLSTPWVLSAAPAEATPPAESTKIQAHVKMCNPRYPYPGCTWRQIKRLEFGSKAKINNHYVKFRWNQSRGRDHALTGIKRFPRADRNMRRMYNRAVLDYRERFDVQSVRYPTWRSFKRASGCGISPASMAMCAFGNWTRNEVTRPVADWLANISRSVIACGGKVLIGRWYDHALDTRRLIVISAKSVVVRTGPGATLAIGACVRDLYYEKFWNSRWNPFD